MQVCLLLKFHPYDKVVCWLGSWHIFKNFLKFLNMDTIFELWGRVTIRAKEGLSDVYDVKKSYYFLRDGLRVSLMMLAIDSYFASVDDVNKADYDGFLLFMSDYEAGERDLTFENYKFVIDGICFPIDLLKNGLRTNDFEALKMLSWNVAFHAPNYIKRLVDETIQLNRFAADGSKHSALLV